MLIANPIYDTVFKRLMENDKVVKFFIGTLLNETIEAVEVKPQEFTYTNALPGLSIFRLDFIATIKTNAGDYKKVLIEIQKAKNFVDLMRFRNYLAEQYKRKDTIEGQEVALPITTIYILGFTLPSVESACIHVKRDYKDLIGNKIIHAKSDFIEKLTHDSYIVQVDHITDRYQTRLDKLLSLFEQRAFIDENETTKDFAHIPDIEELKLMTDILHYVGTNPEERKAIEREQEAQRSIHDMFAKYQQTFEAQQRELLKRDQALSEKNQVISEKEQAISEKDQAISEKDQVISEKEQVISEKEQALSEKEQVISEKDKAISEKDQALSEKEQALSEKDALIAELMKRIEEQSKNG